MTQNSTRKSSYLKRAIFVFGFLFLAIAGLTAFSIRQGYLSAKTIDVGKLKHADHPLFAGAAHDSEEPYDFIAAVERIASEGVLPDENWGVIVFELAADDSELSPETRNLFFERLQFDRFAEHRFHKLDAIFEEVGFTEGTQFEDVFFDTTVESFLKKDAQEGRLRKALEFEKPAIDRLVQELGKRPKYYVPLVRQGESGSMLAIILPHAQTQRDFAKWLVLRSNQSIADGDLKSAWRDIRAMFQLGNRLAQGNFLIEFLAGAAIKSMANLQLESLLNSAAIDKQLLDEIANELPQVASLPPWTNALDRGERAMLMDLFDRTVEGNASVFSPDRGNEGGIGLPMGWVDSVEFGNQWNRLVERIIDATKKSPEECERLFAEIEEELGTPISKETSVGWLIGKAALGMAPRKEATEMVSKIFLSSMTPAFRQVHDVDLRLLAMERNLRLAIAARQFEFDNQTLPDSLEPLKAKVPADVLIDPVNGAELQIEWAPKSEDEFEFSNLYGFEDEADSLDDDGETGNKEDRETETLVLRIFSSGEQYFGKWEVELMPRNVQ